ncbi:polysaccharide deacetylase family protein [Microbacterium album]|uniref:NodB homology domain-containing protein n=1 Tax=Microbacterium album TaxID=2053191 RepID=A0A917IEM9_9MICO|nr:polysaccharide deacetylase family protein [Microbacterium album]GGH37891.1 hypothetical protein GCM10010921_08120 [Microbacterium album]
MPDAPHPIPHIRSARPEGDAAVAALTFDDGPEPGTTPQLLELLAEHRIPAVFAVVGERVRAPGGADLPADV